MRESIKVLRRVETKVKGEEGRPMLHTENRAVVRQRHRVLVIPALCRLGSGALLEGRRVLRMPCEREC